MSTLPQLLEEDILQLDTVLNDLLSKSEATSTLVLDKGGFLITQCGDTRRFDVTTLGALAAAMYAATQGIASLVSEVNFSSVYQQGENFSILVHDVDDNCLLLVIFKAQISVGAVKYYALTTITQIAKQMKIAQERSPDEGLDLSVLNIADTADLFRKKKA
jgi:predicted regulator of Ras-like GTPase activity (Roadblock/LC7/MglB family)